MIRLVPLLATLLIGPVPGLPRAEPARGSARHTVEMRNFTFSPGGLEVAVGDTVVWLNRDVAPHTATDTSGRWDSGEVAAGARWSRVVTEPGRVPYICDYHPTMRGELIVRASRHESPDPEPEP